MNPFSTAQKKPQSATMKKIKYDRHTKFEKQLKKLIKKYPSLEEDLEIAQKYAIEAFHNNGINNESVWLIPKFDKKTIQIYKVKKFACKALRGKGVKSGIRVVYAFYPDQLKVEFLEIYFKEKSDSDMDYAFAIKYLEINLTP
jgi:mRNA-degrading endonuclease RelE of RelBE toxin-antitoxin system